MGRKIRRRQEPGTHRGITLRVMYDGKQIMHTDSDTLHYTAKLLASAYSRNPMDENALEILKTRDDRFRFIIEPVFLDDKYSDQYPQGDGTLPCIACEGLGILDDVGDEPCPVCHGTGKTDDEDAEILSGD